MWAKASDDPTMVKLVQRNPFECTPHLQLAMILEQSEWKVTAPVLKFLRAKHERIFSTQQNENGMQRMRRNEVTSVHKRPSPSALFECLVDRKVLSQAHDFQDPPTDGTMTGMRNAVLGPTTFKPSTHKPSLGPQAGIMYTLPLVRLDLSAILWRFWVPPEV